MSKNSKTSDAIIVHNVRLSFAKLEKPEAYEEGQPEKYQATGLLDPSDAKHAAKIKEIKAAAKALMQEAYGEIPHRIKAEKHDRLPFGMADKHPTKKKYDGYEGMFYVVTSNTTKPAIADRLAQAVMPGEKEFPYSGCYVNLKLSLWALLGPKRVKYGERIGGNLIGVQFVRDGEPFGQGPLSAEEEFEALEDNSPVVDDFDEDDDIDF